MDTTTIMIGLLEVMAFVLPIVLFKRAQRKRAQRMLNDFIALAQQQGFSLSSHEAWDQQQCMGLDTERRVLLHYTATADSPQLLTVHLTDMAKCRVVSSGSTERGAHTIGLGLTPHSGKDEVVLNIYSSTRSGIDPGQAMDIANRWQRLVAQQLGR